MKTTTQSERKRSPHAPGSAARRRRTGDAGQSMLEMALMLPFLLLLMLGIVELGRAIYYTIAVNNGATAAVEYGAQDSITASNTALIQNAASTDANLPANLPPMTVTATHGCTCDTGNGTSCTYPVPPLNSCNAANLAECTGRVVECVQATTQLTFSPLFNYPGLPSSFTANGQAVMRVRN